MNKLFWDDNSEPDRDHMAYGRANCLRFTDITVCNFVIVKAALVLVGRKHIKPFIFVYDNVEYEVDTDGNMPYFKDSIINSIDDIKEIIEGKPNDFQN